MTPPYFPLLVRHSVLTFKNLKERNKFIPDAAKQMSDRIFDALVGAMLVSPKNLTYRHETAILRFLNRLEAQLHFTQLALSHKQLQLLFELRKLGNTESFNSKKLLRTVYNFYPELKA